MLYSVSPVFHGLTNSIASKNHYEGELESIFTKAHKKYPDAEIASIVAWSPINYGIIDGFDGMYLYPSTILEHSLPNSEVVDRALEYIDNHDPKLLFIHFDEVDHAGHLYGWGSKEYYEAMLSTDHDVREIYTRLEERDLLKNSLFIITADHGGIETSHGGNSEEEMTSFFAITGDGLADDVEIGSMNIKDVATVILYSLGVDAEGMEGMLPTGVFRGEKN